MFPPKRKYVRMHDFLQDSTIPILMKIPVAVFEIFTSIQTDGESSLNCRSLTNASALTDRVRTSQETLRLRWKQSPRLS